MKMMDVIGKKILMFSPYGATKHYGEAIKGELERRGAIVIGYDERPSQNALMKIIIRLFKKKVPQIFSSYIEGIIRLNQNVEFDYVLICRGEAFTEHSIGKLRKAFGKAKFILYLWDILETTNVKNIIHSFDKAMSFDPYDAQNEKGLMFRPTFCVPAYKQVKVLNDVKFDIMFVGTLHSSRYKIIESFKCAFEKQNLSYFIYLYVPSILVYIKDLIMKFPYISIKKVNFLPITLKDTVKKMDECRCVLDINYTTQKSLSMRAYEAMFSRRKYITTNSEIKNYDFYNESNILVIDINNPIIPKSFVESPFEDIDTNILHRYSVEGFVEDLFEGM